eukprot:CAMPEP_0114643712 /NCGR_PEP_ID=MMETSP0191-20121206/3553_1 /TAXON_ID=126664 /ORGANISM="Sorites sp." /LENGTH=46 /DNA_ID= /DNA_START= /DNA_END= /DNA_ORIENTATION=
MGGGQLCNLGTFGNGRFQVATGPSQQSRGAMMQKAPTQDGVWRCPG